MKPSNPLTSPRGAPLPQPPSSARPSAGKWARLLADKSTKGFPSSSSRSYSAGNVSDPRVSKRFDQSIAGETDGGGSEHEDEINITANHSLNIIATTRYVNISETPIQPGKSHRINLPVGTLNLNMLSMRDAPADAAPQAASRASVIGAVPPSARSRTGGALPDPPLDLSALGTDELLLHLSRRSAQHGSFVNVTSRFRLQKNPPFLNFYDLVFVGDPGSGAKLPLSARHVMRLSSGGLLYFEDEDAHAPTLLSTAEFRWQRGCVLALEKTVFFGKFRQYKYFSAWRHLTTRHHRGSTLHRLLKASVYSEAQLTGCVLRTVSSVRRLEGEVGLFFVQSERLLVLSEFFARQTLAVRAAAAEVAQRLQGLVEHLCRESGGGPAGIAQPSKQQLAEYARKVARLMQLAKYVCDAAVCSLVQRFLAQLRRYLANQMTVMRDRAELSEAVQPCLDVCLVVGGQPLAVADMRSGEDYKSARLRCLPAEAERAGAVEQLLGALAELLAVTQQAWRGRIAHRKLFDTPVQPEPRQVRSYDQWLQEVACFAPLAEPASRHGIEEQLAEACRLALKGMRPRAQRLSELFVALASLDSAALAEALKESALSRELAAHVVDGAELEAEHMSILLTAEWFKLKEVASAAELMAAARELGRGGLDGECADGLETCFRPALAQLQALMRAQRAALLGRLPSTLQARAKKHLELLGVFRAAIGKHERTDFHAMLQLLRTLRALHDIRSFTAAEVAICNGAHSAHTQLRAAESTQFGALDQAMLEFNRSAKAFELALKAEKELCTQHLPQLRVLLLSRSEQAHARICAVSEAVAAAAEAPGEQTYPERIRGLRASEGELCALRLEVGVLRLLQDLLKGVPDYLDLRYNLLSAANIAAHFDDLAALEQQYRDLLGLLSCVLDLRTLKQQIVASPVAAGSALVNFGKLQAVQRRCGELQPAFAGRAELLEAQLLLRELAPRAELSCFLCVGSSSMAFWKQVSTQVLPRTELSLRLAGADLRFVEVVENSAHGTHSLGNLFKLRFGDLCYHGIERHQPQLQALTYALLTETKVAELLAAVVKVVESLRVDLRDPGAEGGRRGSTSRRYSVLRAAVDSGAPQLDEQRYVANEQVARFVISYCEKTMTSIVDVCYNMKISSLAHSIKVASDVLHRVRALFTSFNFIKLVYLQVNPYALCGNKDDVTRESLDYFTTLSKEMLSLERALQQRSTNGNLLHASSSLQSQGVNLHELDEGFAALYAEMHASVMSLVELCPRLSLLNYTKLALLFRASKLGFAGESGDLPLLSSCVADMFEGVGALLLAGGACTGFVSRDRCETVRFCAVLPLEQQLADFVIGFERELRLALSRRIDEVMMFQIQELRAFLAATAVADIFAQVDAVFEQRLLHLMSSVSDGVPNQVFALVNACRFYEDVALALGALSGCYAHARPDLVQDPRGNVAPAAAASWRDNIARLRAACAANLDHVYQAHAGTNRIFRMRAGRRKVQALCGSLAAQEAYFCRVLDEVLALEDIAEASLYVEGRYKLSFVYLHELRVQQAPFDISIGGVDYPYGLEYFGGRVAVVADAKTEKLMLEVLTVSLSRRVSLLLHDEAAAGHFASVRDVATALGRLCLPLVAAESAPIARLVLSRAVHLDAVAFFDARAVTTGCADMFATEYAKFVRTAADPTDIDFNDQLQFLFDRPKYIRRTDSQLLRRKDSQRRLRKRFNDTVRANCRVGLLLVAVASQASPPAELQRAHQPLLAPILLSKQQDDGLALRLAAKGFRHGATLGAAFDRTLRLLRDRELVSAAVHAQALSPAFMRGVAATASDAVSLCLATGQGGALLRVEVCSFVAALFEALCALTVEHHSLWGDVAAEALQGPVRALGWEDFDREQLALSTTLRHYSCAGAETVIKEAARAQALLADAFFIAACRRLWAQMRSAPVLLLAGESGCGKSSLRKAAAALIERRAALLPEAGAAFLHPLRAARLIAAAVRAWFLARAAGGGSAATGAGSTTVIYNSSLSLSGLIGYSDSSGYWKDGLLTRRLRAIEKALSERGGEQAFTLVLDGPISFAVEQLFCSAYNQSAIAGDAGVTPRSLSLPSGELYPLPPQLRIVIETSDLGAASPFFLAAHPVHLVHKRDAETTCRRMSYPWFTSLQSALRGHSFWIRPLKEVGRLLFGSRLLDALLADPGGAAPASLVVSRVGTFLKYAEQLLLALHNAAVAPAEGRAALEKSRMLEAAQLAVAYSALWAFGGSAAADPSKKQERAFELAFREALYSSLPGLHLPDASVSLFELELSLDSCELRPIELARGAPREVLWTGARGASSMYVLGARTAALESALTAALRAGQSPVLFGAPFSGKSHLAAKVLEQLSRKSIHPLRSDISSETLAQLVAGQAPKNSIPSALGGVLETFAQLRSAAGGGSVGVSDELVHSLLCSRRAPARHMQEQAVFVARTSMSLAPTASALREWLAREFASDVDFVLATPIDSFAVVFIDDVATAGRSGEDDSVQGLLKSLADDNLSYNISHCCADSSGALAAPFDARPRLHRDMPSDPRRLLDEPDNYEMQNAVVMMASGDDLAASLSSRFLQEVLKRSALFCLPAASAAELHQTFLHGADAALARGGSALPVGVRARISSLCEVTVNVSEKMRKGSDSMRLSSAEHRVQALLECSTLALLAPAAARLAELRAPSDAVALVGSFCGVWREAWFDACPPGGALRDKLSALLREELGFADPTKWGVSVEALDGLLLGTAAFPADASQDLAALLPAVEGDGSRTVDAAGVADSEDLKFALFDAAVAAVLRIARAAARNGNILLLGLQGDARARLLRLAAHLCSRELLVFENVRSDCHAAFLAFARGALLRLCGLKSREGDGSAKFIGAVHRGGSCLFETDGEPRPLLLLLDPGEGGLSESAQVLLALLARDDGDAASLFSPVEVMSLYQLMQAGRAGPDAYAPDDADERAPALRTTAHHCVQAFLRGHVQRGLAIVYSAEEPRATPMLAAGAAALPQLHLLRHSFEPLWLATDTRSAVLAACAAALPSNDVSALGRVESSWVQCQGEGRLSVVVSRGCLRAQQQQLGLADTLAVFSLAPTYELEAPGAHSSAAAAELAEWQRETSASAARLLSELLLAPAPCDALVLMQPVAVGGPARAAEVAASIAAALVSSHCAARAPQRRMLVGARAAVDRAMEVAQGAGDKIAAQFLSLQALEREALAARQDRLLLAQQCAKAQRERLRLPDVQRELMAREDYESAGAAAQAREQRAQRCLDGRRQVLELYPATQWKGLGTRLASRAALEDEALLALADTLAALCDAAVKVRGRAGRGRGRGKEASRRAAAFFESAGARARVCALASQQLAGDKQRLLRELSGPVLASGGGDSAGASIDPLQEGEAPSSLVHDLRVYLAALCLRARDSSWVGAAERWEVYRELALANEAVASSAAVGDAAARAVLETRIAAVDSDIAENRRQLESLSSIADSSAALLGALSHYSECLRGEAAALERSLALALGDICVAAALFARAGFLPETVRSPVLLSLRARARALGWATSDQGSPVLGSLLHPLQHRLWFGRDPLAVPRSAGVLNSVSLAALSPAYTYIVDPDGAAEKVLVASLPASFETRVVAARDFSLAALAGWLEEGSGASGLHLALVVTAAHEGCSVDLRLLLSAELQADLDGEPAAAVVGGRRVLLPRRLRLYLLSPSGPSAANGLPSCCFKRMSLLLWSSETAAYCDGSISSVCAAAGAESLSASELTVSVLCMALAPLHLFEARTLGRDVLRLSEEHAACSAALLRALYAAELRGQGSAHGVLSERRVRQLLLAQVPRLHRLGLLKATVERAEQRVLIYHSCLLGALSKASDYLSAAFALIPEDLVKKMSVRAVLSKSIHAFFSDSRQRRLAQGFPQSEAALRRVFSSVLLVQSRYRRAGLPRADRLRSAREGACGDSAQMAAVAQLLLRPLQHCLLEIVHQQVESALVPGFEWLARFALVVRLMHEGCVAPLGDLQVLAELLRRLGVGGAPERYSLGALYADAAPASEGGAALVGDLFQGQLLALRAPFIFQPAGARFLLALGALPAYVESTLRLRRVQLRAARQDQSSGGDPDHAAALLGGQRQRAAEAADNALLLSLHTHLQSCMPRPQPPLSAAQTHAVNSHSLTIASDIAASRRRGVGPAAKSDVGAAGPLDSLETRRSILLLEQHPCSAGVFLGLSKAVLGEQQQEFLEWREALASLARTDLEDPAADLTATALAAAAPAPSRVFRLDGSRKGSYLAGEPLTVMQTMVLGEAVSPGSSRAIMLVWFRLLMQHLSASGASSFAEAVAPLNDWAQLLLPATTSGPPRAVRLWLDTLRKAMAGRDRQLLHPFLLGSGHSRSLQTTKLQTSLAVCRHYLDALLAVVREDVRSLLDTSTLDLSLFQRLSSLTDAELRCVAALIFLWQAVVNTRPGKPAAQPWSGSKPGPWQLECLIFSCLDAGSSGQRRGLVFSSVDALLKDTTFRLAVLYCAACFYDNAGLLSGASKALAADAAADAPSTVSSAASSGEELVLRLKETAYVAFTKLLAAVLVAQDARRLGAGTKTARRGSDTRRGSSVAVPHGDDLPEYRCLLARTRPGQGGSVSRHSFGRLKINLDAGAAFAFAGLSLDELVVLLVKWVLPDSAATVHGRRERP